MHTRVIAYIIAVHVYIHIEPFLIFVELGGCISGSFITHSMNINNGHERLNRTVKYSYLAALGDRSLLGLITTMVDSVLPEAYMPWELFSLHVVVFVAETYCKMITNNYWQQFILQNWRIYKFPQN